MAPATCQSCSSVVTTDMVLGSRSLRLLLLHHRRGLFQVSVKAVDATLSYVDQFAVLKLSEADVAMVFLSCLSGSLFPMLSSARLNCPTLGRALTCVSPYTRCFWRGLNRLIGTTGPCPTIYVHVRERDRHTHAGYRWICPLQPPSGPPSRVWKTSFHGSVCRTPLHGFWRRTFAISLDFPHARRLPR